MSIASKRIRVYFPSWPYPPRDGAAHVVTDQILGILEAQAHSAHPDSTHSLELVTWLDENGTGPAGTPPTPSLQHTRLQHPPLSLKERFLRSFLPKGSASTESSHYPESGRKDWAALPPVDVAIYHYSFAHAWLKAGRNAGPHEVRRIVYFHNLESELAELRAEQSSSTQLRLLHGRNSRQLALHEEELQKLVDEIWFISPKDQERARQVWGAHLTSPVQTRLVSPGYPRAHAESIQQKRKLKPAGRPTTLGFVGALDFLPNRQGLEWILDQVGPLLNQREFEGKLEVVGKGADPDLLGKISQYPWVRYRGFVESLDEFLVDTDLMLIPHVSGSGIRIKLLEALACGIHSLTHPEASDRLHPDLQQALHLQVSADPDAWVQAILERGSQRRPLEEPLFFPECLDSAKTYARLLK